MTECQTDTASGVILSWVKAVIWFKGLWQVLKQWMNLEDLIHCKCRCCIMQFSQTFSCCSSWDIPPPPHPAEFRRATNEVKIQGGGFSKWSPCSDLTAEKAAWKKELKLQKKQNKQQTLNCFRINSSSLSSDQWHKMNKPLSLDKACACTGGLLLQKNPNLLKLNKVDLKSPRCVSTDTELLVNSCRSALKGFFFFPN